MFIWICFPSVDVHVLKEVWVTGQKQGGCLLLHMQSLPNPNFSSAVEPIPYVFIVRIFGWVLQTGKVTGSLMNEQISRRSFPLVECQGGTHRCETSFPSGDFSW